MNVFDNLKNSNLITGAKQVIGDSLRNLGFNTNFGVPEESYDNFVVTDNSGQVKKIQLHKEYLEIINEEKEALAGMSHEEQINYILQQGELRGIEKDVAGLGRTYAAVLLQQEDQTKLTVEGIEAVNRQIGASAADAFGESAALQDAFVKDQMVAMNAVVDAANANADMIVGKKREEVAEILTQEAMKNGLTEEEAREATNNIMAYAFAEGEAIEDLNKTELVTKLGFYKDEYDAYEQMEIAKTSYAQIQKEEREKLAENEFLRKRQAYANGQMDEKAYHAWLNKNGSVVQDYYDSLKRLHQAEKDYNDAVAKSEETLRGVYSKQGLSETEINNKFQESVDQYKNLVDEVNGSQQKDAKAGTSTLKQYLMDFVDQIKNGVAGDVDLGSWDFTSKFGDPSNLGLSDGDISSAVDAAADLKDGLESQRADLTPTFDLDQLASDANKATGIVMSSLMAAQNASIGDYINKDSELNPFMKDRWQNVYNFTQNNYSPKALSRIDIYRQTQRQISMSRGF